MPHVTRQDLSVAIAQLVPRIIQGVQLEFLIKRTLTQTQFLVLIAVHSNGPCPMSVLAKNMHVSMPTMSGIVDRLVKADYIRRVTHPNDRRQVMIELAPNGRLMIKQFQLVVSRRWQEVLQVLEPQEIDSFYQVVSKLKNTLQNKSKANETQK